MGQGGCHDGPFTWTNESVGSEVVEHTTPLPGMAKGRYRPSLMPRLSSFRLPTSESCWLIPSQDEAAVAIALTLSESSLSWRLKLQKAFHAGLLPCIGTRCAQQGVAQVGHSTEILNRSLGNSFKEHLKLLCFKENFSMDVCDGESCWAEGWLQHSFTSPGPKQCNSCCCEALCKLSG